MKKNVENGNMRKYINNMIGSMMRKYTNSHVKIDNNQLHNFFLLLLWEGGGR